MTKTGTTREVDLGLHFGPFTGQAPSCLNTLFSFLHSCLHSCLILGACWANTSSLLISPPENDNRIKWVTNNLPVLSVQENRSFPAIPLPLPLCSGVWSFFRLQQAFGKAPAQCLPKTKTVIWEMMQWGSCFRFLAVDGKLGGAASWLFPLCSTDVWNPAKWELSDCCPGWCISVHAKRLKERQPLSKWFALLIAW